MTDYIADKRIGSCIRSLGNPVRSNQTGFSLIELLCVLVVLLILVGLTAKGLEGIQSRERPRAAAQECLLMLREARELARRKSCRTRVVFSLPGKKNMQLPIEEQPPENSFAIFVFHIPVDAAQLVQSLAPARLVEAVDGVNSPLHEMVAMGAGALPEALIGQWIPSPERPAWFRCAAGVKIDGALIKEFEEDGFIKFANLHFFKPRALWDADATREHDGLSCRSQYPQTYQLTPFPRSIALFLAPLLETTRVYDYSRNLIVSGAALWGDQVVPQFAVLAQSGIYQFELPAVEFASDGSLATPQQKPLHLRFHPQDREEPGYEIAIAPGDGRAKLVSP
ncbi:MAG: hypothetical protein JWL59_2046 [Chthoniobacteraceae bacterium]|nr:hypothetical protein [Chthoniobacteraceae bacterium]